MVESRSFHWREERVSALVEMFPNEPLVTVMGMRLELVLKSTAKTRVTVENRLAQATERILTPHQGAYKREKH